MDKQRKTFEVKQDDGWWIASTPVVDRDKDRVMPLGLDLSNFQKNPVLMWAHDYRSPHSIIGRAVEMQVSDSDFRVKPEWREPASETDPMHIIRSLIDAGLARTMSIGFNPIEWHENDAGGYDFTRAEILEISVVPIPANQQALRLAVKALDTGAPRLEVWTPDDGGTVTVSGAGEDGVIYRGIGFRIVADGEPEQKPYPAEHACRLVDPDRFQDDSFRSMEREHEGKKYRVIVGRLQGETTMTEQAYRYPKDTWETDEARSHCASHDGSFEAAKGGVDGNMAEAGSVRGATDQGAVDEPSGTDVLPAGIDADDGLTPEQETLLAEALDGFLTTIREVLRDD